MTVAHITRVRIADVAITQSAAIIARIVSMSIVVIIGAVVLVWWIVSVVRGSVKQEDAERNVPYEESEK